MKKVIFFVTILISLFVINGLIQSIISLSQKSSVVEKAERELAMQREENAKLKKQLVEVNDSSFVEKEARNKLFLVKPGEQVVLIPSPSVTPAAMQEALSKSLKPNWQQWIDIFFGE